MNKLQQVRQYFKTKRVSNSLLGMLFNPKWLKLKIENPDMEDDESKHFRIGSALDCILTSPELWEDEFVVVDAIRPYGLLGKFVENLPPHLKPDSPMSEYQQAYEESGYKMKLDRVIMKFWAHEEAVNYYKFISGMQDDRVVISKDEYDSVINAKANIMANPFTSKYFLSLDDNIELYHQVPIYFEYKNLECKALMDGIMINHKEKWIQPFDLKTIGKGISSFPNSFLNYGYYRQAAFYTIALDHWVKTMSKVNDLSDYEVRQFQFIVVDSKLSSSHPALIFQCTKKDLESGLEGGIEKHSGKVYRGINELIDAYKWHIMTDKWALPKWIYTSDSVVTLDVFKDSVGGQQGD